MIRKKVLIFLTLLLIIIVDWSNIVHSKVAYEELVSIAIDGFEVPGNWVAKFSKYRSRNWENNKSKPFEESSNWLKWLDSSSYKEKAILPEGIEKNPYFKGKEKTILAIRGKWDISTYNWLIIEPKNIRPSKDFSEKWLRLVAKDKTFEPRYRKWDESINPKFIWLSARTKQLYVYVWGGAYNYKIECHLQDYLGRNYIIPFGSLKYKGWKRMQIPIPAYLKQENKSIPNIRPLKFLRFKIIADPYEDPREFHTYFDYFHGITDIYETGYVGEELQFFYNYWGNGSSNTSAAPKK